MMHFVPKAISNRNAYYNYDIKVVELVLVIWGPSYISS